MANFHHLRNEFQLYQLDEATLVSNPLDLFEHWLEEAITSGEPEPTAMILATADLEGSPSARVVLLKEVSAEGFDFFTNYSSRKGIEIGASGKASLVFFWPLTQRQVRVEGEVARVSAEKSDQYFMERPEGSRISAVASPQSREISSRHDLEMMYFDAASHPDNLSRRPDYWGGYMVKPKRIEFWQGRENRLHDRIVFTAGGVEEWSISRLAP